MNVRILCPGPSLAHYDAGDFAGTTIAVNRAAMAHRCDVWAACDYPTIRDFHEQVIGSPILLTRRQTWEDVGRRVKLTPTLIEDLFDYLPPNNLPWTLYTANVALVYAAKMGATQIDIFGADWKPEAPDFDGVSVALDRSAERFRNETIIWGRIVEVLAGRGVRVNRVLPVTT